MEKKTNESCPPLKETAAEGKTNMDLKEARKNDKHEDQSAGQPFEAEKEALKGIIPPKEVSGNRKENPETLKDRK